MSILNRTRVHMPEMAQLARVRWHACAVLVLALLVALSLPIDVSAQDDAAHSHSLGVTLQFPDDGVAEGEQLCVALFPGNDPDLQEPPLLSRCIDSGEAVVSFDGLPSGEYSVLLPGPGSALEIPRYQGQLVATSIPDDDQLEAFGIDVTVGLAPEFAGTTGRVEVNVYGCPAGTDAGGNREGWASECLALADGVPLTLSGTGSIQDAAFLGITGDIGSPSGRVEFSNLPPGAYELGGDLPANVSTTPTLFVESSIDGSLGTLSPSEPLALRPAETVAVDVYLVLDKNAAAAPGTLGLGDPAITGAVASP